MVVVYYTKASLSNIIAMQETFLKLYFLIDFKKLEVLLFLFHKPIVFADSPTHNPCLHPPYPGWNQPKPNNIIFFHITYVLPDTLP